MPNVGTTGWPSAAGVGNLGWGAEPTGMLLPGAVQGWPGGTQRAASSDAERLLATAVGWWDAAFYRDGDRFLRNRGVAGELLNLRLGSSIAPNSNDPLFLAPDGQSGYVYLPGSNSDSLSVPDEAALDITGDIDLRVCAALDSWTASATQSLVDKYQSGQLSYMLAVSNLGLPLVRLSSSGSGSTVVATSTAAVSYVPGQKGWLRATVDVDNGATGNTVTFYTSTDGSAWTQLGLPVTTAGTISIYSGSSTVGVGRNTASHGPAAGKFYRAIVKNGIDGTTVLDVDCDALTSGAATSFTATTGQTVTINRSTSGRKTVAMPRGGRACFLLGTDDYLECQDNWQHQLLNFAQGDSFTVLAVVRQWATPTLFGTYAAKHTATGSVGWRIRSNSTNLTLNPSFGDGTTEAFRTTSALTAGAVGMAGFVINRAAQTMTGYVDTSATATTPTTAVRYTGTTTPLRFGRLSDGTNYQDFELRAAAVWRRALTLAEITLLSTYFQNQAA